MLPYAGNQTEWTGLRGVYGVIARQIRLKLTNLAECVAFLMRYGAMLAIEM